MPALSRLIVVAVSAFLLASPALADDAKGPLLGITDLKPGDGAEAVVGSTVTVHYTGTLADGSKFDSSRDRGKPFSFPLNAGKVIPGWDLGVRGMKVGGLRKLEIPPQLAYGKRGVPGAIPANATLTFEIELLDVSPPPFTNVANGELKSLLSKGVTVVDIRRPEEWKKTGVVPGSELITFFTDRQGHVNPDFVTELSAKVKPNQPVVLICRTGNRTALVSRLLAERVGYSEVYNVTDGITRWIKDGNPVAKADCESC